MSRQKRNVFLALAQGRHVEGDHIEPVKKVLAKIALRNFFFQVFVGRGDEASVYGNGLLAADRCEALFIQRAQNFGLRLEAHVAHFVEEQRAAMGFLELALFIPCRSGKRCFDVSEKFALDQILGNRGTIKLDEERILAEALGVNSMCYQFLAGPGFAIDKDTAVGRRHQHDLLPQGLHRNAVTHDNALGCSCRLRSTFSWRRRRVSMAFLMRIRVFSSDRGFSRKSKAPNLVARTAVSMVPCPEIIMTSGPLSISLIFCRVSSPSIPVSHMSSRITSKLRLRNISRHSSPLWATAAL